MAQPTIPQPASTVVLIRPKDHGGIEVFMNRRPETMATYAGIFVFPGGRVEIEDWSEKMLAFVQGVTPAQAKQVLGCDLNPELCLGHWVAAVRELFEESGILFFIAGSGASSNPVQKELVSRLAEKRQALQRGKLDFPSLLESEQLRCDVSRLIYFFHRVTPEHYPVRFDTRFYLAQMPANQIPLDNSEEVAESLWVEPSDALKRAGDGNFPMMPPTLAVLKTLASHGSWMALRDAYRLA